MTKLLTEKEYWSTFTDKMHDVTQTSEPVVDIWIYVAELTADKIVDQDVLDAGHVSYVYRNDKNTFEHILLPTDDENVFVVIIVNLTNKNIKGHFRLDLNAKYGLT